MRTRVFASAGADRLSSYFMLVQNNRGNNWFVKGIVPYSAGVVAQSGFEIVRVRFSHYVPLRRGFDAVEAAPQNGQTAVTGDVQLGAAIAEAIELHGLQSVQCGLH